MYPQNNSDNFNAIELVRSAAMSESSTPPSTVTMTTSTSMATNGGAHDNRRPLPQCHLSNDQSPGSIWAMYTALTTRLTPITASTMTLASTVVSPALTSRPRPAIVALQPNYAEVAREVAELRSQLTARGNVNAVPPAAMQSSATDVSRSGQAVDRSAVQMQPITRTFNFLEESVPASIVENPAPANLFEGPVPRSRDLFASAPIGSLFTGDLCSVQSRVPIEPRVSHVIVPKASQSANEPDRACQSRISDSDLMAAMINQNPQL